MMKISRAASADAATLDDFVQQFSSLVIVQAENPDGDSLGSALALEAALGDKTTSLYCPVQIPRHLRYLPGWDRVSDDYDLTAEAVIIVDTASAILLSKLLEQPEIKHHLFHHPVLVIDHHLTESDLPFPCTLIQREEVATARILQELLLGPGASSSASERPLRAGSPDGDSGCTAPLVAPSAKPDRAAGEGSVAEDPTSQSAGPIPELLLAGIMSDTLGLTTPAVTADDYRAVACLLDAGANITQLEAARHELMKKSPRMLDYKADLIKRVVYHLDGRLATVAITWEEIRQYSDEYNPGVLILEELRLVEGVEVAVAIKTYPDGKLTGKIRSNQPVAEDLAAHFGGGGHAYAAGFRIYEEYGVALRELVQATEELLPAKTA